LALRAHCAFPGWSAYFSDELIDENFLLSVVPGEFTW